MPEQAPRWLEATGVDLQGFLDPGGAERFSGAWFEQVLQELRQIGHCGEGAGDSAYSAEHSCREVMRAAFEACAGFVVVLGRGAAWNEVCRERGEMGRADAGRRLRTRSASLRRFRLPLAGVGRLVRRTFAGPAGRPRGRASAPRRQPRCRRLSQLPEPCTQGPVRRRVHHLKCPGVRHGVPPR